MADVKPIPEGYHTVTPYLTVPDIGEAMAFYAKALGARTTVRLDGPEGKLMHGEIEIGNSRVMLGAAGDCEASGKGCSCSLMLYVEDVDAAVAQAVAAGATEAMPTANMFWGDRMGTVTDPFGHSWSIATHVEDLSPEQVAQRAKEFFAAQAQT